ncbi:MAG: trypsin-like peptidase domain-containing protein [Verrucomicrobiales bacterium]|nr:trypsin-like peptidase domain-containing protein [Verrucomicrobiales bacterium]
MNTTHRDGRLVPSCFYTLALVGILAVPGTMTFARENSPALDVARALNKAFVEVAETLSPSVVVIEVAHRFEVMDLDEDNPLFEMIPKEYRKEWLERQKRRQEQRQRSEAEGEREPDYRGRGSGVVIRKEGYILTNTHVVEGAEAIRVRLKNGRSLKAAVRGIDPQSDIAVIKVEADDLVPARLGDSAAARVGEFAIAIGAPFDLDYSVTFGHVSAKGRSHIVVPSLGNQLGASMDQDFIQTDASINPGNSGGPLVNIEGEVIGINTIIRGLNTGIGFAVPINLAKSVAEQLIAEGKFRRAWLGIGVVPIKQHNELRGFVEGLEDGVVVERIDPRGPAFKSELKAADIITAVDGIKVNDAQELRAAVRSKDVGSNLTVDVVRNNKPIKLKIRSEEWPEENFNVPVKLRTPVTDPAPQLLGMTVQSVTKELAEKHNVEAAEGVIVTKVEADSPAARRGIVPGDIITAVNYKSVTSPNQLREALKNAGPKGVVLNLLSARDGAPEFKILKDTGE